MFGTPSLRQWFTSGLLGLMALTVVGHAPCAEPGSAESARFRAEMERSRREMERRSEELRRRVEQELGKRPGQRDSTGSAANSFRDSATKAPESARHNLGTGDVRHRRASRVKYGPKRGQEFVFRVEMTTDNKGVYKRWLGDIFVATVYDRLARDKSESEAFAIGTLAAYRKLGSEGSWTRVATEDIAFPQFLRFSSRRVSTESQRREKERQLPWHMTVAIRLDEMLFPDLPENADDPNNEYQGPDVYQITGPLTMKDIKGEGYRLKKIEQESSSQPLVINRRAFFSAEHNIGFSLKQVCQFNVAEGMVANSETEFILRWNGDHRVLVSVQRLSGDELQTARQAALTTLPYAQWPARMKRVPFPGDEMSLSSLKAAANVRPGQGVVFQGEAEGREIRCYYPVTGKVLKVLTTSNVLVRLDGSNEEINVRYDRLKLPK